MLYYFPRRYDDYSKLKPINRLWFGEEITVIGNVQSIATRPLRGGSGSIVEAVVSDGSGALRVTWFNQPWLTRRLHKGAYITLSGKVDQYLGRLVMTNPGLGGCRPAASEHRAHRPGLPAHRPGHSGLAAQADEPAGHFLGAARPGYAARSGSPLSGAARSVRSALAGPFPRFRGMT